MATQAELKEAIDAAIAAGWEYGRTRFGGHELTLIETHDTPEYARRSGWWTNDTYTAVRSLSWDVNDKGRMCNLIVWDANCTWTEARQYTTTIKAGIAYLKEYTA